MLPFAEAKYEEYKKGCPKCRAKKELREKIIKEFEDAGEEINFDNKLFQEKFEKVFKERLENSKPEISEIDDCGDSYTLHDCAKQKLHFRIIAELEEGELEKDTDEWKAEFVKRWKEGFPQLMSTPIPEND